MALLWNIAARAAAQTIRPARLQFRCLPWTGIRLLSCSQALGNIVKSPFPDVQQPAGNLINTVFKNVHRWGNKTAVECSKTGQNYTYNQLLDGISKWAGFLTSLGLSKGDFIAVCMPNYPEYPIVVLGAASLGIIVTLIDRTQTSEYVGRHLKNSGAKLLVSTPSLEAMIIDIRSSYTQRTHLVMNGPSSISGALNLQDILKDPAIPFADAVELTEKEICLLPYSSGTTGLPKGVNISHGAIAINILMATHPAIWAPRATTDAFQETLISVLPFYHMYGMLILLFGLHSGCKMVTFPFFEPELYIHTLKKHKVETLHVVPHLINFLTQSPLATSEVLASLKNVIVSATTFSPLVAEAFRNKCQKDIFIQEVLGMTEIGISCAVPLGQNRVGTCGTPVSNVSCKIVDTMTGSILGPNQAGEICFKTPSIMNGYFENEAETLAVIDEEGWLHSGDVGFLDNENFLKIVDRMKDLIKVKGVQVSPSELEAIIRQHPQVLDAAVVGVLHERQGEAPSAFVVTKEIITEEEIHRFVESRVSPYQKLRGGVTFVKELPRTPSGKLLRKVLKEKYF